MFKPDFQDGGHGSHFGFCIGTIFFNFLSKVALIFLTKFQVNWPLRSVEVVQNRFLRWQRWPPSWFFDQNNFSYFWLTSCPNTSFQVLSQLAFRFRRSSKSDFQHGSHLGFLIGTILAISDLQVTLVFPSKFLVSWPFSSEVQNRFSRLPPWRQF